MSHPVNDDRGSLNIAVSIVAFCDAEVFGGAQVFLERFAQYVRRQNGDIALYAANPELYGSFPGPVTCLEPTKRWQLQQIFCLARNLRHKHLKDIALLNMSTPTNLHAALIACNLAGLRKIAVHHSAYYKTSSDFQNQLARMGLRTISNHVVVGDSAKAQLSRCHGVPKSSIVTWYPGVDLERFSPDGEDYRDQAGLRGKTIIGCIARISPKKGVFDLVRAFDRVRGEVTSLHLVLVGTGPDKARLIRLVADLGLDDEVTIAGFDEQIENWYRTFDLFCLPSHQECVPLTMLEAMACGRPLLITDVGSISNVLHGTTAEIVQPNVEGLANGLRKMLAQTEDWENMGYLLRLLTIAEFDEAAKFRELSLIINHTGL